MIGTTRNRRGLFIVALLVILTLTGCGEPIEQVVCAEEPFRQFYVDMGGYEALGPCISSQIERPGALYQYTQNVLMVYNPNATSAQRYSLSKIGYLVNLDLEGMPDGGYEVWDEVKPLYDAAGGKFGWALTEVLRDNDEKRFIQYFEGAAFYRNFSDAPGTIRWLPYGFWFCGEPCEAYINSNDIDLVDMVPGLALTPTPQVTPSLDEITQMAVATAAQRWDERFTGPVLSPKATQAADGWYELAYENIVLAVDPENYANVILRPIPEILGTQREMPVACGTEEDFTCYLVTPQLGFMVSDDFVDFIIQYGGWEAAGQPITALRPGTNGTSYQCFENLCLEYRANAPEGYRVSVMPLGSAYYRRDTRPIATPDVPRHRLTIETWPAYSLIPNGQAQEIYVQAIEGTLPVEGVLFNFLLTYPDGRVFEENFPLTDSNGQASLTLEPIIASDGTNVPYVACYLAGQDEAVCINGIFTIWSSAP